MMHSKATHGRALTVLFSIILLALATGALAQDPVSVDVAVTGDPVPGATVTATATVTINDGSTMQSIMWSQVGGLGVTLANETTNTVSITFPDRTAYRDHLIEVLEEAPKNPGPLPGDIPVPDPFHGGLQHRWTVVGINPLAEEHAAAAELDIVVTTSSGTYTVHEEVMADLPWAWVSSQRNVAVGVPVVLHGKTQDAYDWALTAPGGSSATLMGATTQNPEFTPDMAGEYTVTVTDNATDPATPAAVSLKVYAGTWRGVIKGQDSEGRPIADTFCTMCHNGDIAADAFTPWIKSGHAEIFAQNINTENNHYSANCVVCHTVGYNPNATNNGVEDVGDWAGVLGIIGNHGALDNWTNVLAQYPANAQRSNIQCENCHGPNSGADEGTLGPGHGKGAARTDLSSDTCAVCHGEPPRHGRFQQWQLSKHANYETAQAEARGSCAKCHTGQGFVAWVKAGFGDFEFNETTDTVHPITCATCHEPHNVGTTSGSASTNATVRIMGDTPMLDAGFIAKDMGKAATCMACHNGRRGLKNDTTFGSDLSRAPHQGPQADMLMGENMYFTEVSVPGFHSKIPDPCVTCHMEETDPPPGLSYNLGGTNHTFFASETICSNCHTAITPESVQGPTHERLEELRHEIEMGIANLMRSLLLTGNTIELDGIVVDDATDVGSVEFLESHGRQGIKLHLTDGSETADVSLNSVQVVNPAGDKAEIYTFADPTLPKSGWNFFMVESDRSMGVHNPAFINGAITTTMHALEESNVKYETSIIAGGPGNGVGAVSCTGGYVYWVEIAGRITSSTSGDWRTDLVARNLTGANASVTFYLHEASGTLTGTGTVDGKSQKAFEDVVGMIGGESNIGALEVCSDQPLLVLSRIFNQQATGTYGQGFDGKISLQGMNKGETGTLIGMRQVTDAYRTNLSVTNTSKAGGEVSITLFDAAGTALHTYTLAVAPGEVRQDVAPFANRANAPDVGWGYATVTVVDGANIMASASMIDLKTNDPTTIPAKR